jgi:hypothetical protein
MTDFSITHYATRGEIANTILSGDDENILYVLDQLAQSQAIMPLVDARSCGPSALAHDN